MSGLSDKADHPEICWRDHFGSEGSEREFLVRLPDGFMLSCGIDGYSERRAKQVARMLQGFPDLTVRPTP
jgi:hypothetical protein